MESKDDIENLLPHRPPMVLLAQALQSGDLGTAEAVIDTSDKCVFFDRAIDGVPSCVAIEYMAQTMALAVGRERRRCNLAPAIGFVLGSRRLEISVDRFARGSRYVACAKCIYSDGSFASFDCAIRDESGSVAASATFSAFQPPDDGSFLEELA